MSDTTHKVMYRQFLRALLGQEDTRKIGEFILFREKRLVDGQWITQGVSVLTQRILDERIKATKKAQETKSEKPYDKLKKVREAEDRRISLSNPAPISDEELNFIEGGI